jgi:putative tryptophan/tyrosine transport system substrate-binding protein
MRRYGAVVAIATILLLVASQAGGQQAVHRIGYLGGTRVPELMQTWLEGLRARGYVEGQNVQIEYRWYQGRYDQIPALLAELVAFGPEVLVTSTSNAAVAVHTAAPAIPLVFFGVSDPVGLGLVESLAHPGGNATGLAALVPEGHTGKQLQLLKEFAPQASRIAVLVDPMMAMHQLELRKLPETGRQLGVELVVIEAGKPDQFETAFEKARTQSAEAIHVWNGPHAASPPHSAELVELAARYRLPAMYMERQFVQKGGLVSYGPEVTDKYRRAGAYVDKILKGEKPGDLPVEQPTRFELIVNLKTAKALGVTVPLSILAGADEVIE